jgi:hypothetical protein
LPDAGADHHHSGRWPVLFFPVLMLMPLVTVLLTQVAGWTDLREDNAEGAVFKRIGAPYSSARPSNGGDQFKHKFVETASVVASAINTKRSVQMAVWKNTRLVPCGNVTIPADQPIPQVGDLAESVKVFSRGDRKDEAQE